MVYFTANSFFLRGKPHEILYHLDRLMADYLYVAELLNKNIH